MPDQPPLLLLTRPEDGARRFVEELRRAGIKDFEPIFSPLIGIALKRTRPDLRGYKGVIFSSATGALAFRHAGGTPDLPAFAIGKATAKAAEKLGWTCQSADGDADALVTMLLNLKPPAPLLHIRGEHSRGAIAQRLSDGGISCHEAVLYGQPTLRPTQAAVDALNGNRPVVAPVFSPRTAYELIKIPVKAPLLVAAMSEAVAKPFENLHIHILRKAAQPDSQAMLICTANLLDEARSLERRGRNL